MFAKQDNDTLGDGKKIYVKVQASLTPGFLRGLPSRVLDFSLVWDSNFFTEYWRHPQ
jgi:hypothetical protein